MGVTIKPLNLKIKTREKEEIKTGEKEGKKWVYGLTILVHWNAGYSKRPICLPRRDY